MCACVCVRVHVEHFALDCRENQDLMSSFLLARPYLAACAISLSEHHRHCVLRSFRLIFPFRDAAPSAFWRFCMQPLCALSISAGVLRLLYDAFARLFCAMTRFLRQDSHFLRLPGPISSTSFPEPSWLASARAAHHAPQHFITWRGSSAPLASTSLTSVALETPLVFSALNCVLPPHVFLPPLAAELPFHSYCSSPMTGVSNDAG